MSHHQSLAGEMMHMLWLASQEQLIAGAFTWRDTKGNATAQTLYGCLVPLFGSRQHSFRWWSNMNTHTLKMRQGSTLPNNRRKAAQSEEGGRDNSKQAIASSSQFATVTPTSVQYYQQNILMQAQIRAMTRCQHLFQYKRKGTWN